MEKTTFNRTTFAATIAFNLKDRTDITLKDVPWKNGAHVKRGSRKIIETWYAPSKDIWYVCMTDDLYTKSGLKALNLLPVGENKENHRFPVKLTVTPETMAKTALIVAKAL